MILFDCAAVTELGAAYIAKYGEHWNNNLDNFTAEKAKSRDNETDDAMKVA